MQNPQEHKETSSISQQRGSSTAIENQKVEPVPRSRQGLLAAFENTSLKTQQIVISCTLAVISSLAVLVFTQISANTVTKEKSAAFSQQEKRCLASLVTGLAVAGISLTLERISSERISRSIDNLKKQLSAAERGELGVHATIESPNELGQLAISFNQMVRAIATKLSEAEQKAKKQEKAKEDLQIELIHLRRDVEKNALCDLPVRPDTNINQKDNSLVQPDGTIIDFFENLQKGLQPSIERKYSSTVEEIQQLKEELEYRNAWLEALLYETKIEIESISKIPELTAGETPQS